MKKTLLTLCCASFALSACTMFPEYMRDAFDNPYIDQTEQMAPAQSWQANYATRYAYGTSKSTYATKQARRNAALNRAYHDRRAYNAKLDRILLMDPTTREMVSCSSNSLNDTGIVSEAVENCAINMEKEGFVRVTDIPRFTAPDDQFSQANYPSGRFRGIDPTPRW